MTFHPVQFFDPIVDPRFALAIPQLIADIARKEPLRVYLEGPVQTGFGAGLVRRHDAAMNYLLRRMGTEEPVALLARLNLFRKTLALHKDVYFNEIAPFYHLETLLNASKKLTACNVVEPAMLYVNILLPGQELALHTDTPEYRGLDKWKVPEWFMVVMCHSGLFEVWRKRVAAAVAFFTGCRGGDFLYYPDGPHGRRATFPVRHNTAIQLDVDSIFHGVDRVGGKDAPAPPLEPNMELAMGHDETFHLRRGNDNIADYSWDEVRLSLQWKANCYADEAERELVGSHNDDLTLERVLECLTDDLRRRGRLGSETPPEGEFARMLIDEYVRFPKEE